LQKNIEAKNKPTKKVKVKKEKKTHKIKPSESREWLWKQINQILQPQPLISISEFCDGHLIIPPPAAEPGPYRISRTPYAKEPMDACSPSSKYKKIVLYTGTQLMKTQLELNVIYYYAVNSPTSILFVFSNDREGKLLIKTRVNPMIDANSDLKERIGSSRSNSKGDTAVYKEFSGGFLKLASGQSAASLKSTACQIVIIDEFDEMPDDVEGQGSVDSLATERSNTYSGRQKIIISSTTTNKGSKIVQQYEQTDMRHLFVTCPHCHEKIEFEWENFKYSYKGTRVDSVWYECPKCKIRIDENYKRHMIEKGEWIPTNKTPTDPTSIGFWLPGLCSPWKKWSDFVVEFLNAEAGIKSGKHEGMKAFYNNVLALPYIEANDRPDWKTLYRKALKESIYHKRTVPKEVLVITTGADVQDNRIEVEIKGWGRNGRSWSIDYLQLFCPPGTKTDDVNNEVWNDYESQVLRARFLREDGVWLEPMANAMDRAHATPQVNALWMRMHCPRFYLVRGSDSLSSRISMEKEDKGGGSKDPRTNQFRGSIYKCYDVGVSTLKAEVYSNLLKVELIQDGKIIETPNMMYFPDDYDEEYYRQLTSEEYTPSGKSNKKGSWKTTHDRNEVLDCTVYALAMWYKLDLHRWGFHEYDLLETQLKNSVHEQQMRKVTAKQNVAKLMSTGIKY